MNPTERIGKALTASDWPTLNQMTEQLSMACFVMDRKHTVCAWNTVCEALTGIRKADVFGTKDAWRGLYNQEMPLLANFLLNDTLEIPIQKPFCSFHQDVVFLDLDPSPNGPFQWEVEAIVPGKIKKEWLSLKALSLKNDSGELVGALQTATQLTDILDDAFLMEKQVTRKAPFPWHPLFFLSQNITKSQVQSESIAVDILQKSMEITKSSAGVIEHFDPSTERHLSSAAIGRLQHPPWFEKKRAEESQSLFKTSQPQKTQSLRYEKGIPLSNEYKPILRDTNKIRPIGTSLMSIPVTLHDETVGRITLKHKNQKFDGYDCMAIKHLANMYALAIARHKSYQKHENLEKQIRLAQKMESIGQLAGGVAHDFNNLLTIISASCLLIKDTLQEIQPQDETLLGDLNQIENATKRASALTSQLLAMSRRQLIETESLDINGLIESTSEMIRQILGEEIELTLDLTKNPILCLADRGQIEQVIMNLVLNARDSMRNGGEICIKTDPVELNEHALGPRELKLGKYLKVSIQDTGSGMDSETQQKIFEPFFTTKKEGRGTGLGLAVVYGIVKQHDGHIWVESQLKKGTTFSFCLPQTELCPRKITTTKEVPNIALPSGDETVLVVDDEEALRTLIARVLKQLGYEVLEAQDGIEAITVASMHSRPIDLLITDVVMPGADGRQVAEAMREDHPQMRTLFMSGYTNEAIQDHGIIQEMMHFIKKPFTPRSLAFAVRQVFDSQK